MILLFPLGELGRFNVNNEISTTVNDVLVFSIVAVWLVWLILKNRLDEIPKRKLTKPIFIFILIAFVSLLFNINSLNPQEFLVSFLYLLRFISYSGIYFIITGFDKSFKRKILALMFFSGMLIVLGGFIQYFFYPNLRNLYYLGWDEHLYRLFGSFFDPNFAASIISLFLILLLTLLLSSPINSKKITAILIVLSILSFIALLLTYSRSGYLMFFVSAVSLLLMFGKKKYVAILLVVFTISITLLPKNLGGEGVKLLRTASLISRSEYLKNAVIIFKDHPILGVGFNSYRYAQHRYGFIDDSSLRTSHAAAGTDNSFLFVLATTGIVGFTFYIYMWFRILRKAYRDYVISNARERSHGILRHSPQNDRKYVSGIILASSIGLFVNSFFINSLFYPSIMLWMWVLIGLKENR